MGSIDIFSTTSVNVAASNQTYKQYFFFFISHFFYESAAQGKALTWYIFTDDKH